MVTRDYAELMARINVEGGERFYLDFSSEESFRVDLRRHFGDMPMAYAQVWRDEKGLHVGGHDPAICQQYTSVMEVIGFFVMGVPVAIPEITPDYVPPPPPPLAQPLTIIFPTDSDRKQFMQGIRVEKYSVMIGGIHVFGHTVEVDGDTIRFIKK